MNSLAPFQLPLISQRHRMTRWLLAILTFVSTVAATRLFFRVVSIGGINIAEWFLVPLFSLLFGWIAFSFWTATAGLLAHLFRKEQPAEDSAAGLSGPVTPTAILMPIYNESPANVFAGVQAMLQSLVATGRSEGFDIFVLSDTTDPDIWLEEERTWARLIAEHGVHPRVFYRRRPRNVARKAGNIADFCTRWGSQYTYMIVLDADSVMEGATLVEMVRRMDSNPELGILQVPPTPVNRMSLFARLQQFSSRLYGPVFIEGFASWAHYDSNYWGHNAIIRVEPFTEHCGLPTLPGKAPLGGEILSHDFVEAALIARAGWKVALAHDLGGSYEECPTTILDFAKRDQRWCQGNMQHIRLIFSEGFRPISRLHLAMGAMSYLSSPLWMLFMLLSTAGMLIDGPQMAESPKWMLGAGSIFGITMALLMLPKVWALIALSKQPQRLKEYGGWDNVVGSVLLEMIVSALVAPLMMFFHTRFVLATLLGEKVHWNAQNRGEGDISFGEALVVYGPHMTVGLTITVLVSLFSAHLMLWFLPVVTGLILAVPLAMVLGSVRLGQRTARQGLLLIPEEINTPEILSLQKSAQRLHQRECDHEQRDKLFGSVLTDPSFHALHRNILQATDAQLPIPREELLAITDLIHREGPQAVPRDARRMLLSDAQALRDLHVQIRSRLRMGRSTLSS